MTTTRSPFGDRPFLVSAGAVAGLGRGAMAGNRFERPFHGVRQWAGAPEPQDARRPPTSRERMRRICERYAVRLRPGQFYSHDTALALLGAPTPDRWEPVVHVSAYRPAAAPRTRNVVGHRLERRDRAPWQAWGFPVEDPSRAWVQTSRSWAHDDLVAAADFLVLPRHRLATISTLAAEAARIRGRALDHVIADVRIGSDSARETRLRLVLVRAGLPEPELNIDLRSAAGAHIARLDQAYRRFRVAVEYDGRQHATDAAQFARDADRWDAIRAAGWDHVRILDHHLRGEGRAAVAKVRAALLRAGWSPSPARP